MLVAKVSENSPSFWENCRTYRDIKANLGILTKVLLKQMRASNRFSYNQSQKLSSKETYS